MLDELGAMLTLLRHDGEAADRRPTPGLERLGDLVAASHDAQLPVSLRIDGPTALVRKPVAMAAYRIVQESLTNVVRHASAARAVVTVRAGPDGSLAVEVCDDGTGRNGSSPGSGVGIRGMRERAEATGGSLEAGNGRGGGFVVRARWDGTGDAARVGREGGA